MLVFLVLEATSAQFSDQQQLFAAKTQAVEVRFLGILWNPAVVIRVELHVHWGIHKLMAWVMFGPVSSRLANDGFKEDILGTKKSGKGRRKLGRKKRRMRAKIRHRKK